MSDKDEAFMLLGEQKWGIDQKRKGFPILINMEIVLISCPMISKHASGFHHISPLVAINIHPIGMSAIPPF